ncbi:unnamed protein product, partial [Closterium sp. Naga37s-1]
SIASNLTSLPSTLVQLSSTLTALHLGFNRLTGTFPSTVTRLLQLRTLNLANNQLTGKIPTGLAKLSHLAFLRLDGNQFTGPIPSQLYSLTNISYLSLHSNRLSGSIAPQVPFEAPQNNPPHSSFLKRDLRDNMLTSSIPSTLPSCVKLLWLAIVVALVSRAIIIIIPSSSQPSQLSSFLPSVPNVPLSIFFLPLPTHHYPSQLSEQQSPHRLIDSNRLSSTLPAALSALSLLSHLLTSPVPPILCALLSLSASLHPSLPLSVPSPSLNLPATTLSPSPSPPPSAPSLPLSASLHPSPPLSLLSPFPFPHTSDASNNTLTGPIPPGLGELSYLAYL